MSIKVYVNPCDNMVLSANDYEEMIARNVDKIVANKEEFDNWLDAHYSASEVIGASDDDKDMLFEQFRQEMEQDVRRDIGLDWSCHLVNNC